MEVKLTKEQLNYRKKQVQLLMIEWLLNEINILLEKLPDKEIIKRLKSGQIE